jgi:uncharacterized protein (DUF433 family)
MDFNQILKEFAPVTPEAIQACIYYQGFRNKAYPVDANQA